MEVVALKFFSDVQRSLFFSTFSNVQCLLYLFESNSIQAKMLCSKFQLSALMKRKNLSLDEKMKVIDYADKNTKVECRVIVEHFSIGKTCVSNILRKAKTLRMEYQCFKGNCRKLRHRQYHLINEILIAWHKKCVSRWPHVEGRSNVNKRKIKQR